VDVLETISSTTSPSNREKGRVERRLPSLKRTCEKMIRDCQGCKENFGYIHDRLKSIGDDLDQKETELEREIQQLRSRKRKSWFTSIISCVVAVAIAAVTVVTGIPVFAGGLLLGTGGRFAAAGIFSVLQLHGTKVECDQYMARIEKLCNERNVVQGISEGVFMASSSISEITEWWHSAQEELIRLEELSAGPGLPWGSIPETTYSLNDWERIGQRFDEYSGRMGGNAMASTSERRESESETITN